MKRCCVRRCKHQCRSLKDIAGSSHPIFGIGCPARGISRHEGVLALRAAGPRLPKRWPAASAVRQREGEVLFECVSALGVGSDGFRGRKRAMMHRWSRPPAVCEQLLPVKHSVHRRFRRDVDAFVGQRRHDLTRGMVPESLAREHIQHPPPLLHRQGIPRRRTDCCDWAKLFLRAILPGARIPRAPLPKALARSRPRSASPLHSNPPDAVPRSSAAPARFCVSSRPAMYARHAAISRALAD